MHLENTEFIDKLANQIGAKINDLVATPVKVDELKVDTMGIWPHSEDVGVINFENAAPKANKIIFKVASEEGNETTATFDKEGITLSVNKPKLKEEFKGLDNYKIIEKNKETQNDEVILNIDGVEVAKILKGNLELSESICNIEATTANISELKITE